MSEGGGATHHRGETDDPGQPVTGLDGGLVAQSVEGAYHYYARSDRPVGWQFTFLASEGAAVVPGQTICADGGAMLGYRR